MQHVHTGNSELSQSYAKKRQCYTQSLQLVMSIGFRRKFYLQPSGHSFLSTSRHENSPVCCLLNKYRSLELSLTCDN